MRRLEPLKAAHWRDATRTAIPVPRLQALARRSRPCGEFVLHPRVEKIIDDRRQMAKAPCAGLGMAETWPMPACSRTARRYA